MKNKKIAIASDHGGYELKCKLFLYLKENYYNIEDLGTYSKDSCDYPLYAKKVVKGIIDKTFDCGILICGTGLGMQIAANRFKGIRAACVSDTYSAKMSRQHNNANILTMGERVVGFGLAKDIADIWLNTEFLKGRHQKRIDLIDETSNI